MMMEKLYEFFMSRFLAKRFQRLRKLNSSGTLISDFAVDKLDLSDCDGRGPPRFSERTVSERKRMEEMWHIAQCKMQ